MMNKRRQKKKNFSDHPAPVCKVSKKKKALKAILKSSYNVRRNTNDDMVIVKLFDDSGEIQHFAIPLSKLTHAAKDEAISNNDEININCAKLIKYTQRSKANTDITYSFKKSTVDKIYKIATDSIKDEKIPNKRFVSLRRQGNIYVSIDERRPPVDPPSPPHVSH